VVDVEPARQKVWQGAYFRAVRHLIGRRVEAASRYSGKLVWFGPWAFRLHPANPLIAALRLAYERHYPVVISPDVFWLMIAQGLARHVRLNAEDLRDRFVGHCGQKDLVVKRDDFVKGSPENPWPEVFGEFSEPIRAHIGPEKHELFVADFSTTTPTAKAAMEIVLFDAMQPYFRYITSMLCGIPSVVLEGTPEDWYRMVERVQRFTEFGLSWWVGRLVPVLRTIAESADGRDHRSFWQGMISKGTFCGQPLVGGWVQYLFPYLKNVSNPASFVVADSMNEDFGAEPQRFPNGFSEVPFILQRGARGPSYPMRFVGGLLGVAQDADTLALRPEIGWAVCDDTPAQLRS
jgi:hypothetical protein